MARFGAPGAQVPQSDLSDAAQAALSRFMASGVKPHVILTHTASREDTAKVSDQRAAEIVALEASYRTVHLNDAVERVRSAMRYSSSNPMYATIRSMRAAIGREFAKPLRRSSARKHSSARQHLVRVALLTYLDPGGHFRLNGS
jgi:hypothetical protein